MNKTIQVSGLSRDDRSSRVTVLRAYRRSRIAESQSRPIVQVQVDTEALSPLAKFLAENVPNFSNYRTHVVRITSNEGELDRMRADARNLLTCQCIKYPTAEQALQAVENLKKCYDMKESDKLFIHDYMFPQIMPMDSAEEYMEYVANAIISTNASNVSVTQTALGIKEVFDIGDNQHTIK